MTDVFALVRGSAPLVVSAPHVGIYIPPELGAAMTPEAVTVPDTDWHIDRLYAFALGLGASMIVATHSRFVVDLNRDPGGRALYPGASNTELCPLGTFASGPVYRTGGEPDPAAVERRVDRYWRPYHEALAAELERVRQAHGVAVLWDAHSIVSRAPRFFEGVLPDFNLGTADGASCDAGLATRVEGILRGAPSFTTVHNGRFKGGYITRRYGRPAERVHALQLEMAQSAYMTEGPPFAWNATKAAAVQPVLERCLDACLDWARRAQ
ncbi:MAG: N-formylglutamate deformylase [Phreatobacter sp.]|uniref:N-formylglutamate deformylase n=1 Tax=Phreatobacter sp. TaxID=1966341 RepID=UPI001A420B01|nr:N-formylglutamate deformylase [Phreatobacter sp.]MBL8567988.1 N-formylglutamate deformylase [Phreatobacter sp.]